MTIHNFRVVTCANGKTVETSPRKKDGGFQTTIYMRNNGDVNRALMIDGYYKDGKLHLRAYTNINGKEEYIDIETER